MMCHCTLAGSLACLMCQNNKSLLYNYSYNNEPIKITEKFDDKGNLIERITENTNGI